MPARRGGDSRSSIFAGARRWSIDRGVLKQDGKLPRLGKGYREIATPRQRFMLLRRELAANSDRPRDIKARQKAENRCTISARASSGNLKE
jgi:hypothetical protein